MCVRTFFPVIVICFLVSCKTGSKSQNQAQDDCIKRVVAIDDSIGRIRNRECETLSLSQTIANYTKAMEKIDTKDCPKSFSKAYHTHRGSWDAVLVVTDQYPDLRGEMHVLFKQLEQSRDSTEFKKLQADIWSTWAEVEKFIKK